LCTANKGYGKRGSKLVAMTVWTGTNSYTENNTLVTKRRCIKSQAIPYSSSSLSADFYNQSSNHEASDPGKTEKSTVTATVQLNKLKFLNLVFFLIQQPVS
jgi:hypothetical protein